MNQECELTPVELYFCARLMKAKYLDYAYIRAMPDVQKRHLLHEQEAWEQLEEKEIVEMDFDGNAVLETGAEELLRPLFYGEKESRLDVDGQTCCRFHIGDGKIVMSVMDNRGIRLKVVSEEEIDGLLDDGQVEIHLSDIHAGRKSGVFAPGELADGKNRKLAVRLLKGEE